LSARDVGHRVIRCQFAAGNSTTGSVGLGPDSTLGTHHASWSVPSLTCSSGSSRKCSRVVRRSNAVPIGGRAGALPGQPLHASHHHARRDVLQRDLKVRPRLEQLSVHVATDCVRSRSCRVRSIALAGGLLLRIHAGVHCVRPSRAGSASSESIRHLPEGPRRTITTRPHTTNSTAKNSQRAVPSGMSCSARHSLGSR